MKLNLKLLKRLFLIDHESYNEADMVSFIINYCYKIPNLKFEIDQKGNLFITRNTNHEDSYPCIVAHLDGVNSFSGNRELVFNNGIITARYIKSGLQCGLNADDSNGICCALQLLEAFPDIKICFTVQEEVGGIGADFACENIGFFSNVRYLLQADRRGSNDLITITNGINSASKEFVEDIKDIMDKYHYKEATGTFTDIGILAEELCISGVNISCGYLNEHFFTESCNIRDLENCLNFMHDIIKALDVDKEFYTIQKQKSSYVHNYVDDSPKEYDYRDDYYNSFYDNYYSNENMLPCDKCSTQDCMNCDKQF